MFTEKIKNKFNKTFLKIIGEAWDDINYISKNRIISSINATISKLDLVTREEFEIQVRILQKSCQEIDNLKVRISKIEEKIDIKK
jgi:BMFP domain-containing protein YqiC